MSNDANMSDVEEWANQDRQATAYHGAGHVVAYLECGLDFECVTAVPDGDTAGVVVVPRCFVTAQQKRVFCHAGAQAKGRFNYLSRHEEEGDDLNEGDYIAGAYFEGGQCTDEPARAGPTSSVTDAMSATCNFR